MTWDPQVRAGFETQSEEEFITIKQVTTLPEISSTKARTGTYTLRIYNEVEVGFVWETPASRVQCGAAVNHVGVSQLSGSIPIISLRENDGSDIVVARMGGSSGLLELYVEGVLQDSEDAALSGFATWDVFHEIGVQINVSNDVDGFASFYVNGIKRLEYSGAISSGDVASMAMGGVRIGSAVWNASVHIDDVMLDTSTITEPDVAPPNIRLEYKTVSAGSGTPQWTPVGAASNWDCVNDAPPDVDATYVETDVNNDRDLYTFGGYTAPAGYTIEAVIPVFVARKTAASSPMQIEPVVDDGVAIGVAAALDLPSTYGYVWRRFAAKPSGGGWGTSIASGVAIGMDAVVPV